MGPPVEREHVEHVTAQRCSDGAPFPTSRSASKSAHQILECLRAALDAIERNIHRSRIRVARAEFDSPTSTTSVDCFFGDLVSACARNFAHRRPPAVMYLHAAPAGVELVLE